MATSQSESSTVAGRVMDSVIDIAVVGAGPAGLSAAVAAAEAGAIVALIDAEAAPGGQFWRHPADNPGDATSLDNTVSAAEVAPLHHGLRQYRALRRKLAGQIAAGRVTYFARHEVWAVERVERVERLETERVEIGRINLASAESVSSGARFAVHAMTHTSAAQHEVTIRARSLVLATGAYDLQLPFPGWDLPGVMTAGGVQSLLKGHAVVAGRRVAVAGTGPFLLSVAAGLAKSGATVVGVFDAASPRGWLRHPFAMVSAGTKLFEGAGYAAELAKRRIGYHSGWTVIQADSADGGADVDTVTVAPISPDGSPDSARSRTIKIDVLAVGWGFVPQLELALALGCRTKADVSGVPIAVVDGRQRSSEPGVYIAGEICGVGGAALAVVEGELAGLIAAAEVSGDRAAQHLADHMMTRRLVHLAQRRTSLRTFANAMAHVYPVPYGWSNRLPDETVVCRCEEVTAGEIRDVVRRDGVSDARSAKLLARPGMGWCQGRVCGYATECLTAAEAGVTPCHRATERPVALPIRMGLLDRDESE
ncbi:MAG: FAD-dependent oxidoreductase [Nakamurella sp.]